MKDSVIVELGLLRELKRKSAEKGNFEDFIYYTDSEYKFNWHHKRIAEKLQEFLEDPNKKNLAVFVPPQHGKSQLTSRLFPAFALGQNPNLRICLLYTSVCRLSHRSRINRSTKSHKHNNQNLLRWDYLHN